MLDDRDKEGLTRSVIQTMQLPIGFEGGDLALARRVVTMTMDMVSSAVVMDPGPKPPAEKTNKTKTKKSKKKKESA